MSALIGAQDLDVDADKVTTLNIDGSADLDLVVNANTVKLATIDAGEMSGDLTVAASGAVAMTITGGSGDDELSASFGATAKADVLNGGDGNDILYAGTNGARLNGGDGNDIFVLTDLAGDGTGGNKEANTYSIVEDFNAGDLLQLTYYDGAAIEIATGINELEASLNEETSVFGDFVDAAMQQIDSVGAGAASEGQAVWFNFNNNLYVVVESNGDGAGGNVTGAFDNGEDLIIRLNGVSGDDLSFNADFGTLAIA